jgi:hypothetical protein
MLRDFLADWALSRARKAARTARAARIWTPRAIRQSRRQLARSEWWHDVAAWLDGIGAWPGLAKRFGA